VNPFELADYAAATVALLVGVTVGRWTRPRSPKPLQPICSCKHGYGTHEDGLRCHGVETNYRNSVAHVDACPCRRYDGPDPAIFGIEAR
jgi:hypothetical protein